MSDFSLAKYIQGVIVVNKKAQKIATWIMLILMVGSVVVGILAYLI